MVAGRHGGGAAGAGGGNSERRDGINGHLHRTPRRLRPFSVGPGDARSRGGGPRWH